MNVLYQRFKSSKPSESHKSYLCNLLRSILENTESLPSEQCNYINEMLSLDEDFVDIELEHKLDQMITTYENPTTFIEPDEDYLIIDTNVTPTKEDTCEEQLHTLYTILNTFNKQVNLNNFPKNNREPYHSVDEYKQYDYTTPTSGNENSLYTIHRLVANR